MTKERKNPRLIRSPIPLEAGSGLELRIDLGEFRLVPVGSDGSEEIHSEPALEFDRASDQV
jgi:hypothetical protein